MPPTLYRSSDTNAPQLTGTAGSLTTLLDAILVGTAGIAYGTTPSAGWTTAFTGTNARSYRMATTGGALGYYLDVNDNAPGAGGAREARMRGYEAMTALATGTNPFPTTAQLTAGIIVRKSTSLDTLTRPWVAIGDNRTFYLFILSGDTAATYLGFAFGEYYSYKANDPGRALIIGRVSENSSSTSNTVNEFLDNISYINATAAAGNYMARDFQGTPGSVTHMKYGEYGLTGAATANALIGNLPFTNPVDNRVYMSPIFLANNTIINVVRGRMRGFWHFCHAATGASDGDVITGSQDLLGRSFYMVKSGGGGGIYTLETSNTWETN